MTTDDSFDIDSIDESDNQVTTTDLSADAPRALVSRVHDRYSVIGNDNGQTTYANDLEHAMSAEMVKDSINDTIDVLKDDEEATVKVDESDGSVTIEATNLNTPATERNILRTVAQTMLAIAVSHAVVKVLEKAEAAIRSIRGDDQ